MNSVLFAVGSGKKEYTTYGQDKEKNSKDVEQDFTARFWGGCGFTFGEQAGFPQTLHQRAVQQGCNGTVEAALDQIKGKEYGNQHGSNIGSILPHVQGSEDVVPGQHHGNHEERACKESDNGAGEIMPLFVKESSGTGKGTGGQDIHDHADPAGIANGEHFQKRYDKGYNEGSKRAI